MSDTQKPSGAGDAESGAPASDNSKSKTVSYDDHKRLLDDAMKFKAKLKETEAKLSEFEKSKKDAEEKKLAESGEFQKLIQIKESKIGELESKLGGLEENLSGLKKSLFDAAKLNAVRDRLPGTVKNPAYMNFIDVDAVAINPETNEIDLDSVDRVVDIFVRNHPDLLKTDPKRLPGDAARTAARLSWEQWNTLPSKEKKAQLKNVEGFKSSRK